MQEIRQPVLAELDAVNQLIIDNLHSDVELVENIGHYIVDAGGKRLRPLLSLLTARCFAYDGQDHIKYAAVIEFIHTATLLHDDVVDISSLRRGRTTANAEFGNAPSVLVGDFLYTRAFQLLVEIGNMDIMRDVAATTNTIAEGEVLQLVRAGDPSTSEEQYLDVITRKTAILFATACYGAGTLAKQPEPVLQQLHEFGLNTGIAFQIFDDVLDYAGDPDKMGKNVGDDLAEGKPTLPLIYVLRTGSAEQRALVEESIRHKSAQNLAAVVTAVQDCGALDYAREVAARYQDQALATLQQLPQGRFRDAMWAITELSTNRQV
ncbi:MAG: polyprenyl synthetase family protein [Gammaproteobacteria bacterium]|nr:polyprenyl synthetase family protein [Gammaproteobacteria bacterium]